MDNKLQPVMEGVFEEGPPPRLRGAVCPGCGKKFFPKPMVCPHCLGEVQDIELGPDGRLYTFAVVRTKAPYNLPQPYAVGWVDLEDHGLRIFSLLDPERIADLRLGQRVGLCVGQLGVGNDGQACLRYYFTPQGG